VKGRVYIIGLGDIGLSLAKGFCSLGIQVIVWDNDRTKARGLDYPLAGEQWHQRIVPGSVIILATPALTTIQIIERQLSSVADVCTVIDTTSVKTPIIKAMASSLPSHIDWVGGHPLGKDAFRSPWRLCGPNIPVSITKLFGHAGINWKIQDSDEHDREAARYSHYPRLLMKMLIHNGWSDGEDWPHWQRLVSDANNPFWDDVLSLNKDHLRELLEESIILLKRFHDL
jgi:prephenate dehydrogenase